MSADLILAHIKSLLPPGSLYTLDEQGDLYKLFEAIAENYTDIHEFLGNLANIRDPLKTQFLEELENELWGDDVPDSDALRSHIYILRKAVDRPFEKEHGALIKTVKGVGLKIEA